MEIVNTSTEMFEIDVLRHDGAVLVDFWASWCHPCKQVAPLLEDIAKQYSDNLKVVKVNVDEHPQLAQTYGVRGIPTLMFVNHGELIETKVGSISKSSLTAFVEQHI